MHALNLDFLHPVPPRVRLGFALLALGVAITAWVAWRYVTLAQDVERLEARLADVQRLARRDLPRVRETAGDPKLIAQEVNRANAVLASLTLPWDAMFGQLEAAGNESVALLAIQPEATGQQVRLSGEARRFEDLLAYIGRLEASSGFANVFLAGHELKAGGAVRPVQFSITADWVAAR